VDHRLEGRFGPAPPRPARDPLSELVLTILSQNTSDLNTHRAETSLRSAFPRWEDVLTAPVEAIETAIRVGGLSNLKAPRIRSVLAEVKRREGSLSLGRLAALPLPEVLDYLESIPGVGPKTAACVALFALGKPAFPVDTHVHRVARRLGLIGLTDDAAAAHRRLAEAVAPGRRYPFHVHLIELGRAICHARRPQCEACPLTRECDYFKRER